MLAYAITLITRNGSVPLTLLIINDTVVPVSYMLTKITDLAAYLPDIRTHRFIHSADLFVDIAR